VADRFGNAGATARWLRFERLHIAYWEGRWETAVQLIEETLSEVGQTHALSRWAFEVRGRIRVARDDVVGAVEDARRSLELGRPAKDPQTFLPALSSAAMTFLEAGRIGEAEELAKELLVLGAVGQRIPHYSFQFDVAWVLLGLDRSNELAEAMRKTVIRTPWIDAAEALAHGDYGRAADLYARSGTRPLEAYTRLRAAAQVVAVGRRAEAGEQLQKALGFWRSVGARRYVRQGEALLAKTA